MFRLWLLKQRLIIMRVPALVLFLPGQRLSGVVLCDLQGAAPDGWGPGLGSFPGWVVVVVVAAAGWGLPKPQPCVAGRRTGRGI